MLEKLLNNTVDKQAMPLVCLLQPLSLFYSHLSCMCYCCHAAPVFLVQIYLVKTDNAQVCLKWTTVVMKMTIMVMLLWPVCPLVRQ